MAGAGHPLSVQIIGKILADVFFENLRKIGLADENLAGHHIQSDFFFQMRIDVAAGLPDVTGAGAIFTQAAGISVQNGIPRMEKSLLPLVLIAVGKGFVFKAALG